MNLIIEKGNWYLLLVLLGAAGGTFLLYFRSPLLRDLSVLQKRILPVLRFIGLFLQLFLLLEPLISQTKTRSEKPVLSIVVDNSASILNSSDSVLFKNEINQSIDRIKSEMGAKFAVELVTFGEKATLNGSVDFSEKKTDVSQLLEDLYLRHFNGNLGAVILISDGLFNSGSSPLNLINRFQQSPFLTLGVGDTLPRKDLQVTDALFNRTAFLGNDFPIEVFLSDFGFKNMSSHVHLLQNGNEIKSQSIVFNDEKGTQRLRFMVSAKSSGLQKFSVIVNTLEGEFTSLNNRKDFYIEVLDSRQKVLLLAQSPHPDVAAIKESLLSLENYEVKSVLMDDFDGNINPYSLVILHQIPGNFLQRYSWASKIKEGSLPFWIIGGLQSDISVQNNLLGGIQLNGSRGSSQNAQALTNPDFTLFKINEKTSQSIRKYPPLTVPFGEWKTGSGYQSLLFQRIGNLNTTVPLFLFSGNDAPKRALLAGEGIWRWKLNDFQSTGNHDAFNELIQTTVQYLATMDNKDPFRVFVNQEWEENQNILFEGELYNPSFQLINEPEVDLKISDEDGKEFSFAFSRTANAYRLDAGKLRPGSYSYSAQTTFGGKKYVKKGSFLVSPLQMEFLGNHADHQILRNLSAKTNGRFFSLKETDLLIEHLKKQEDITAVTYEQTLMDYLLERWWVFFVIILAFSTEWLLRKRAGAY